MHLLAELDGWTIGSIILLIFLAYALRLCRTGKITWRGAQINAARSTTVASSD